MSRSVVPLVLSTLSLGACDNIDRTTAVATGYVSHQLCSATFVSQLDPDPFYRQAVAPILSPVSSLESHRIDRQKGEVTSRFAGLSETRAVYRGPLGCLVLHGEPPAPVALPAHAPAPALLPEIAGPQVVEPNQ